METRVPLIDAKLELKGKSEMRQHYNEKGARHEKTVTVHAHIS